MGAVWYPVEKLGLGADYIVSDDAKTVVLFAQVLF
jgi:hypothetical protein